MPAQIRYNLSILKAKNVYDIGISDPIQKLERFNKQLLERRSQVLTKAMRLQTINKGYENGIGPLSQDDPYLRLHCDQHPQYMPFDAYMYPSVTLSTMLTAQSEFDMLTAVFGTGMAIEAGTDSFEQFFCFSRLQRLFLFAWLICVCRSHCR